MTDEHGMIPLPNHLDLENLFRSRRPTDESFFAEYPSWVIVSFSAKWCAPCKRIDKSLLVKLTPDVKWYSVDIDINKTSLGYCGLYSIPAFMIVSDGTIKNRRAGAISTQDILDWFVDNGVPVVGGESASNE
jgi:hypothetical protein